MAASLFQLMGAGPRIAFGGNPNVNITSIDATNGIVKSRATGNIPAFVQVSAAAVIASGTAIAGPVRPYEDLEYSWDFGDPSGTEIFTNPVTLQTVNMNTQTGPEAVYCYRTTGTKTITLSIRGKKTGGYITASTSTTFNVVDPGWTNYYFDSNAGVDGDGTIGSPWNDPAHILWQSGVTNGNGGVNLYVKCGSVVNCTGTSIIRNYYGTLRMYAYGTGAKPIFNCTNPTTLNGDFSFPALFQMGPANGAGTTGDVVISNMDFRNTQNGFGVFSFNAANTYPNTIHDVYFDNTDMLSGGYVTGSQSQTNYSLYNMGVWGGTITYDQDVDADHFHGSFEIFWFMYGTVWQNQGAVTQPFTTLTHSIYYTILKHSVWKYNKFAPTSLQNHLKMSCNDTVADCPYHLISSNYFTFTDGTSPGRSNEDSGAKSYVDFVIENNAFVDYHNVACDMEDPATYTVRNNFYSKTTTNGVAISTRAACFTGTFLNIYGNMQYGPYPLMSFNSFGWDSPNQVTGNIVWNTGIQDFTATAIIMVQADQVASGTYINNNSYYAPNNNANPPKLFSNDDAVTYKTLAQWQAAGWDNNSTVLSVAPNWTVPFVPGSTPLR